jgi:hypothetical protein
MPRLRTHQHRTRQLRTQHQVVVDLAAAVVADMKAAEERNNL